MFASRAAPIRGESILGNFKLVPGLQPDPEFRRGPQKPRQPECSIRSNGALSIHDVSHALRRYTERERQLIDAHPERCEEILAQDLTWMHGGNLFGYTRSLS